MRWRAGDVERVPRPVILSVVRPREGGRHGVLEGIDTETLGTKGGHLLPLLRSSRVDYTRNLSIDLPFGSGYLPDYHSYYPVSGPEVWGSRGKMTMETERVGLAFQDVCGRSLVHFRWTGKTLQHIKDAH